MKSYMASAVVAIAFCSVALPVQAAPPEGKGPGNQASNPGNPGNAGKGNPHISGHPNKGNSSRGQAGPGNSGKGGPDLRGNRGDGSHAGGAPGHRRNDHAERRYDERGRYYGYFDDHRDDRGRIRGDDLLGELVYAGITAALAREYARDFGLSGYQTLPPGIRKNLARGKPLPPGIAKKMVPGSFLGRLPHYPGYEWRVAGTDLILISVATAVIADILYDVFE